MNKQIKHFIFFCLGLVLTASAHTENIGDSWSTTRGDETPGLMYFAATKTDSGRIIAIGDNARLMLSDDGGTNWTFRQIEINGEPVRGTVTTIYQVPGGNLIAVLVRMEESTQGFFKYQARSYLLTSSNNGNSWTMSPFPKTFATFQGNGKNYYGVNISGLHQGPGGELLAYGTISGSNNLFTVWHLGGLIFRKSGNNWVQAMFEYGPVRKIANANGRAVATTHNAILDSADGAGWNGYPMYAAQVSLNGSPMDAKTQSRLRVLDVEVLNDGTYIAQGGTFVPYGDSTNIDTNILNNSYKMSSPTPFSGARNWTAYDEPYHGSFTKLGGSTILSASYGGAYITTNGGPGFSLTGPEVRAPGTAIAVSSATTAIAVQSSETVWKSTDTGGSWVKVWDKDVGPDLYLMGYYNGILYAKGRNKELWVSRDNGVSWQLISTDFEGGFVLVQGENGQLIAPDGKSVSVSNDGGVTWIAKPIGIVDSSDGGYFFIRSTSGRLILPAEGANINREGKFYVSDDGGETWAPRNAGLEWLERARAGVQTKNGRIIVATNTHSLFNPRLVYSDDDGDTWRSNDTLKSLEGLDTVTNDPGTKVVQVKKLLTSKTGRILAMSKNVIFTSDDNGDTWLVRDNLDFNGQGRFDQLELSDIVQVGTRWIAIGSYEMRYPLRGHRSFLLISDDDGATWGMRPFETNQSNTGLNSIVEAGNGRVVITGTNAAVFISDGGLIAPPTGSVLKVREGKTEKIPISRPNIDGDIDVNFGTRGSSTAKPNIDFIPTGGTLHWDANDTEDKFVTLEVLDNDILDGTRELSIQVAFEASSGLLGTNDVPISIIDNDSSGTAGLIFDGANQLYTSETGETTTLGIALESKPSADVVVTVSGVDTSEGQLSKDTFTFTPENWGRVQNLIISGVDDTEPDGDVTYNLVFAIVSNDTSYNALSETVLAVVNIGDEPLRSVCSLDIDGNGNVAALSDGLLTIRYEFGFRDTVLINEAVGSGCTRCDAHAISAYLHQCEISNTLDIDGNGSIQPLTDGLLTLRYLFGFTGTDLTKGAIGDQCTRCNHVDIKTFLDNL